MRMFLLVVMAAVACSAPASEFRHEIIPVLHRTEVHDEAGQFALSFTSGDGTQVNEQGALKPTLDGLDKVLVKQGSYSYTSPEGIPFHLEYIADEYGFRPTGKHLPVAPEAP